MTREAYRRFYGRPAPVEDPPHSKQEVEVNAVLERNPPMRAHYENKILTPELHAEILAAEEHQRHIADIENPPRPHLVGPVDFVVRCELPKEDP
jgi:hypothetical protein